MDWMERYRVPLDSHTWARLVTAHANSQVQLTTDTLAVLEKASKLYRDQSNFIAL